MPFVHITWLPKACRTAQVRQEIAKAVMKVMVAHDKADIVPDNLVVRFSEAVDGFSLPKGHSSNPQLAEPQQPHGEAYLKDREPEEMEHMEEKNAKKLKTQKDESKAELKTKDDALEAQENIHKVELKKKDDEIKELKEKIKEWEKKAAPLLASLLE